MFFSIALFMVIIFIAVKAAPLFNLSVYQRNAEIISQSWLSTKNTPPGDDAGIVN
jgi:hypothetical protein